jgi:hypothetical protein
MKPHSLAKILEAARINPGSEHAIVACNPNYSVIVDEYQSSFDAFISARWRYLQCPPIDSFNRKDGCRGPTDKA